MTTHVLLLEDTQGATLAIRFPSAEAARDWEDKHPEVRAVGCAPVVAAKVALAAS